MKLPAIMLLSMLLMLGCISMGNETLNESEEGNTTAPEQNAPPPLINETNQSNQTSHIGLPPTEWTRYNTEEFSFEYPAGMVTNIVTGKFLGTTPSGALTTERIALSSLNTLQAYGANKDGIFKANPTKAASDFLLQDAEDDPLGIFDDAESVGELSTFTLEREVYVAQVPFKLRSGNVTYTGYALSMFIPERSLHIRARILAIEPDRAEAIRDNFILSFRLE
ncbi:hypothetical protein H0O00_02415 [Candidatus Micrarchaeota archaeon]|nr:hypothetical protein [Candidatus Micrarchaeota archaeon]